MEKFMKGCLIEKVNRNFNKITSELITAKEAKEITSVSEEDITNNKLGYVVCVNDNPNDNWFVSEEYMLKNYKVAMEEQ